MLNVKFRLQLLVRISFKLGCIKYIPPHLKGLKNIYSDLKLHNFKRVNQKNKGFRKHKNKTIGTKSYYSHIFNEQQQKKKNCTILINIVDFPE